MARRTVVRHPNGSVTEVTTSTSLGRSCSALGWFFLALFVFVGPAVWWGVWSVPAYVLLVLLFGLGLRAKVRQRKGEI